MNAIVFYNNLFSAFRVHILHVRDYILCALFLISSLQLVKLGGVFFLGFFFFFFFLVLPNGDGVKKQLLQFIKFVMFYLYLSTIYSQLLDYL